MIVKFTQKKEKAKKGEEDPAGNSKELEALRSENEQLKKKLQ